jgi:type IV pilus assembly protein PilA
VILHDFAILARFGYDRGVMMMRSRAMQARSGGFSMLELMVVVAIIAILALLAAPNFQDSIVRNEIKATLPLADIAKQPVAAMWAVAQAFPKDNTEALLPPPEKIVNNQISSVAIANGAINITFGNNANGIIKGKVLTLRPAVVLDAPVVPVTWVCGTAEAPNQMTVQGVNNTNIPDTFLPFNCRAHIKAAQ